MPTKKQGRVAERVRQVLSQLLQFEARDPRLADVVVLDVEVDREIMYATVYVTAMSGEDSRETVLDGLRAATGFLRRELGAQLSVRHVPDLRWVWDETTAYAEHIENLLDTLDIPPEESETDSDSDRSE